MPKERRPRTFEEKTLFAEIRAMVSLTKAKASKKAEEQELEKDEEEELFINMMSDKIAESFHYMKDTELDYPKFEEWNTFGEEETILQNLALQAYEQRKKLKNSLEEEGSKNNPIELE